MRNQFGETANPNAEPALAPVSCSLSGLGAEIIIAQWEARAAQCEQTAEQLRSVTQGLVSSYLEKSRAYRACIQDLRQRMDYESKRQPTENEKLTDAGPKTL